MCEQEAKKGLSPQHILSLHRAYLQSENVESINSDRYSIKFTANI